MCGRFVQSSPVDVIRSTFQARVAGAIDVPARYNVSPGQDVLAVVGGRSERHLGLLRWGLVPFFRDDPAKGPRSINARAESVAEKPAFRHLLRSRRCVVPADGFYEWKEDAAGKTPHFVRPVAGAPLALAGLWDRWQRPGATAVSTCVLLTCAANTLLAPIHERMPVLLTGAALERWLDPAVDDENELAALLRPAPSEGMEAYAVSRDVNSPRNEAPSLIERLRP